VKLAIDVGQGEIRRLQRGQLLALIGAKSEIPRGKAGSIFVGHWLMQVFGKGREIEPGFALTIAYEFLAPGFG
jgi:hypothetical protein